MRISLPRVASRGRLRIALLLFIVLSIVIIGLIGAPFVFSFSITRVTFQPNVFVPITSNGGFEQDDGSWLYNVSSGAAASIVSGTSSSGSKSLYLRDPGAGTFVLYNNNITHVLPLAINQSTAFGLDLLYKGSAAPTGSGSVWVILFISWRLDKVVPVTVVLGNYSGFVDYTFDNVTVPAGVIMFRGVRAADVWTSYDLQLGTPRLRNLVANYLLRLYGVALSPSDPLYINAFLIKPVNVEAYVDNVGVYNVQRATASLSLSKPTLLPSTVYGANIYVNGSIVPAYDYSYGLTVDTFVFPLDLPLAFGADFRIIVQTTVGLAAVDARITQGPEWV